MLRLAGPKYFFNSLSQSRTFELQSIEPPVFSNAVSTRHKARREDLVGSDNEDTYLRILNVSTGSLPESAI